MIRGITSQLKRMEDILVDWRLNGPAASGKEDICDKIDEVVALKANMAEWLESIGNEHGIPAEETPPSSTSAEDTADVHAAPGKQIAAD